MTTAVFCGGFHRSEGRLYLPTNASNSICSQLPFVSGHKLTPKCSGKSINLLGISPLLSLNVHHLHKLRTQSANTSIISSRTALCQWLRSYRKSIHVSKPLLTTCISRTQETSYMHHYVIVVTLMSLFSNPLTFILSVCMTISTPLFHCIAWNVSW